MLNTSGTVTVPNATDTLVGKATTDVLTNKTLSGNTATNLISGSGTLTLNTSGTVTLPNATDTLVGKATTDTLTNKTLTSPVINSPTGLASADVGLGNVDNTSDATKNAATVTLTNKTLTSPIISTISNTGTLTLPTSTDTLVGRATTDTLTNKTLTSPVINTPTGIVKGDVGLGNVDNTSDATKNAATATLTNKTITSPSISAPTITGGATVRGDLLLQNTSGSQPTIQLSEDPDNGTNKVTIQAPATLASDYTLTLPPDDGTANQVLQTDGNGGLSWATPFTNPMNTVGDTVYGGASGAATRLAGDTTNTKKWLRSLSSGGTAAAPTWEEVDQVKGRTDGSTVPTGYIGERIDGVFDSGDPNVNNGAQESVYTITLNKGVYQIYAKLTFTPTSCSTWTNAGVSISTTTDTEHAPSSVRDLSTGTAASRRILTTRYLVVSADSTPVYVVATADYTGGGTQNVAITSASSDVYAIRIA